MGEVITKTGPSNGATGAGDQDRPQGAEQAPRGDFRGMTVRQVVEIGKNSDPEGAVRYLSQLSKDGDKEALQALRAAARAANSTFDAIAKIAISVLDPASQKQGRKSGSVQQNIHPFRTGQDRYKALTGLLKSEYRGRVNQVFEDTNLLTGKNKVDNEISLTIVEFHEKLEDQRVAHIAINWLEELENCNLEAGARIKIQTRLVSVLNNLERTFILALEELRESRKTNSSKDVVSVLSGCFVLGEDQVKRLFRLGKIFGGRSLKEIFEVIPRQRLSGEDIQWLVQLDSLFDCEPFEQLYEVSRGLNNEIMERLRELKELFDDETLESCRAATRLNDEDMKQLKELKKLFDDETLVDLFRGTEWLEAEEINRLKELRAQSNDKRFLDLCFQVREL